VRTAFLLCLLTLSFASSVVRGDDREAAKAKLAPLQDFVGEWKGMGQRERGKSEGGWIEKSSWAWKFGDDSAAIAFESGDAKYLADGALRPTKNDGEYELTIHAPDEKLSAKYVGKLADGKLVLETDKPVEGLPVRISLRLLAEGKRLVALYEVKSKSSDRYVRLAEVGYTRVGSGFGAGSQGPECLITGGFGSMQVMYEGKTYFVCCTGCKDYFDEDPKRAVEEYLARKEKEKEKTEKK
jgi:YHS domain-containing protein